jgi:N-acylneuraminate cytidylyltransferase
LRPRELSYDYTGTTQIIAHAIQWQNENQTPATYVCCIYATVPFLNVEDLRRGLNLLQSHDADYAFGVTRYAFSIQRAIRITSEQTIKMFQPDQFFARSQDLEEAWHDAGQFYWGKASAWIAQKTLFIRHAVPIYLPRHRIQDIDTEDSCLKAEEIFCGK